MAAWAEQEMSPTQRRWYDARRTAYYAKAASRYTQDHLARLPVSMTDPRLAQNALRGRPGPHGSGGPRDSQGRTARDRALDRAEQARVQAEECVRDLAEGLKPLQKRPLNRLSFKAFYQARLVVVTLDRWLVAGVGPHDIQSLRRQMDHLLFDQPEPVHRYWAAGIKQACSSGLLGEDVTRSAAPRAQRLNPRLRHGRELKHWQPRVPVSPQPHAPAPVRPAEDRGGSASTRSPARST